MVLTWNDVLLAAVRTENARAGTLQGGPGFASRNMAMVHGAMFDAVNAIDRTHAPLVASPHAADGASKAAAVAGAAYHVLMRLYPDQQDQFDASLADSLAAVADPLARATGYDLGRRAAEAMVSSRAADGAFAPADYQPGSAPGQWRPDPIHPTQQPMGPHWGNVRPFALTSGSQFRPPPPPELTSAEYAASFHEARLLGAADSTLRTAEQTEVGVFWGYDAPGMGPPPVLYNQIAATVARQQGNTLEENARMFALVNVAMADAGIVAWDAKYVYDFWRPITAIREADTDGNPLTVADRDWRPLGAPAASPFTPPFPAYTSGHATFGAALFRSLERFYGRDDVPMTLRSDELPGVTRSFARFSDAAAENGISRIYLGIHWDFDNVLGQQTGREVADHVFAHVLTPIPEPAGATLLAAGAAVLWLGTRSRRRRPRRAT